jgi:hypothetical protein
MKLPLYEPAMKASVSIRFCGLAGALLILPPTITSADTLVLQSRSVSGTVLQTNGDNVVLLTDYGTLNYSLGIIKEIKIDRAEAVESTTTARLPEARNLVIFLSRLSWAANLRQIPATVIDKGILRNVPYVSYRCGEAYEVNIYGDPNAPAGIEAGVTGTLVNDDAAKNHCTGLISGVLGRSADREVLKNLNLQKDLKTSAGLTFEITPPSAEDSYGGWWISVYSEQQLNQARASDAEMKDISLTKVQAVRESSNSEASWSPEDLKLARQPRPTTISFTTPDGQVITDAEVVSVTEGVSVIWRKGASGGVIKLANLPEDLRRRFGYDPAKAAYAEEAEKAKRQQAQVEIQAAQSASTAPTFQSYNIGSSSVDSGVGGGSVYVHGYYRKNGTYVSSYTRRR